MHHELKLAPVFFDAKLRGVKPWELRSTEDRDFIVGDTVTFYEFCTTAGEFTGKIMGPFTINYVLVHIGLLQDKTCIFSHEVGK